MLPQHPIAINSSASAPKMKRRAGLFAIGCVATAGLSAGLRPSRRAVETYIPVELEAQIPKQFFDWQINTSVVPVLPDLATQATLHKVYTQTLARTYVNRSKQQVMVSIAYGADQGSDITQAHRPEICYAAQGFRITRMGQAPLTLSGHEVQVARLFGMRDTRQEYITYWVTLNDKAVLPGLTRQLAQLRLGLAGIIPDGMLVRVSTVGSKQLHAFELQDTFLFELYTSLTFATRARYFGR